MSMQVGNSQKWDFPGGSVVKNPGDPCSIPGLGRFPREGNDNPLLVSCLENDINRGAWQLQSMGSQKSQTCLSN